VTAELIPIESTAGAQLCTLEQVKSRLGMDKSGDDDKISALIAAVLPTFSKRLRRELMPHVTAPRSFDVEGAFVALGASDLRSASSVVLTLDDTDRVLTPGMDYMLWPFDALTGTAGYLKISRNISLRSTCFDAFGIVPLIVTGDWGIWDRVEDVPADVNIAAIETVLSWLDRPSAEIAMMGGGDPRYMEPAAPQTWDIPASAWRKLSAYNRPVGVV